MITTRPHNLGSVVTVAANQSGGPNSGMTSRTPSARRAFSSSEIPNCRSTTGHMNTRFASKDNEKPNRITPGTRNRDRGRNNAKANQPKLAHSMPANVLKAFEEDKTKAFTSTLPSLASRYAT